MQSETLIITMKLSMYYHQKLYNKQYFPSNAHLFVGFHYLYQICINGVLLWKTVPCMGKCLLKQKQKIQIGNLFNCNSDSVQPLTVHSHQLLCVQPNYSGTCNTAKSCTKYSHHICSVHPSNLVRDHILQSCKGTEILVRES